MRRSAAGRVALGAVFTALSFILLYGASSAPFGHLGLVALAGMVPAAVILASGSVCSGLLCCMAAGLLGLLTGPDKGSAVLYLLLFGPYPAVKAASERIRCRWGQAAVKLCFFNLMLTACRAVLHAFALPLFSPLTMECWILYPAGNLIFLAYDFGFSQAIALFRRRLGKILYK